VNPESSNQLFDFALVALDHAADSVIASGGPLTPFSLIESRIHVESGKKGELTRFPTESLEEGIEHARDKVRRAEGVLLAAVAWDGYVTLEGERTDAVLVEASQARDQVSLILAQRYVESEGGRLVRLGNPVKVAEGRPLF
jgi:hypothetical protein